VHTLTYAGSRSESKKAAAAAAVSEDEDGESEAEEPAPTSDIEMPDVGEDGDEENDPKPASEDTPKKKKANGKAKAGPSKGKGKGKGKGGVSIPDEWHWEDAKKIFELPDVLPADEIEVWAINYVYSSLNTITFQLEWKNPDVEGLVQFLVTEKGFKCVSLDFGYHCCSDS
jgi:flap endonuclease-1